MEFNPKELKKRSEEIDRMLLKEKKKLAKQSIILMLGAGQSGKSTFCKQMRILNMFGFSDQEKLNYKAIVHTNIIDATLDLIHAATHHSLTFSNAATDAIAQKMYDEYRVQKSVPTTPVEVANMVIETYTLDESLAADVGKIWNDPNTKGIIRQAKELVVLDSMNEYLQKLDSIASPDYQPSDQDILLARVRTTAVSETTFEHGGIYFRIIDVGGQKGEREKWLPLFAGVTAIIFCVASSDYDLVLEEDGVTNRMHDSLQLFKEIALHRYLRNVPIILFLNKKDLLEKKINEVDLKTCFPDYKGGKNFKACLKYLENKFTNAVKDREAEVFVHATQATDTSQIQIVWQAVKSILLKDALDALGGFGGSV
jgi:guanine nucleotide-binding protein G(o) subunit alpha